MYDACAFSTFFLFRFSRQAELCIPIIDVRVSRQMLPHPRLGRKKITSEEKRAEERLQYAGLYDKARKAAEVHRQVRRHAQSYIKPGIKLIDMCTMLEEKVGLVCRSSAYCCVACDHGCLEGASGDLNPKDSVFKSPGIL